MQVILSQSNNPYHNIATEEYLLKNSKEDIFFLYINSDSIVIGKHQNTLAEINYNYVTQNDIPVVRRLSGGGTVFHDSGNINFCFIASGAKGELVNFEKYTQPVVSFLQSININAHIGGRNDILIDACKISGNASHVFKSRVMHHGTLLFKSELDKLTNSLKNDPLKFKDKAVKSVRSKVTNIKSHLQKDMSVSEFVNQLQEYIVTNFDAEKRNITEKENETINKLTEEKYNTWMWNYGYSPKYGLKKRIKGLNNTRFEINLFVNKGIITEAKVKSNTKQKDLITTLENNLEEVKIHPKNLRDALSGSLKKEHDITSQHIIDAIF